MSIVTGPVHASLPQVKAFLIEAAKGIDRAEDGDGRQPNQISLRGLTGRSSPLGERQTPELRRLAVELTRGEQRERKRLAELLHDHLQQLLVAARLRVHLIGKEVTTPAAQKHVMEARTILDKAIEVTRTLAAELCPLVVTQLGLAEGLKWLANWVAQYHGLKVRVSASPDANPAAQEVQILLYQCVRELLFNAVKHARSDRAAVHQCRIDDRTGAIVVSDRGEGFEPSAVAAGMGLSLTRQRLEAIGGILEVRSAPGRGTRLEMRYPLTVMVEPVRHSAVRDRWRTRRAAHAQGLGARDK